MKSPKRTSFVLLVLLLVTILAATVGGSTTVRAIVSGACPFTPAIGSIEERTQGLAEWNQARALTGTGLVVEDTKASIGAQAHSQYVFGNSDTGAINPVVEDPANDCFTFVGNSGAASSITRPGAPWRAINNVSNMTQAIDALMGSVFDRLLMINPRLVSVGLGITFPAAGSLDPKYVVDIKSGRVASNTPFNPILYPVPAQQFVPTQMNGGEYYYNPSNPVGSSNPLNVLNNTLGSTLTYPTGYPISAIFDPNLAITVSSVTLLTVGSNLSVPVVFIDPGKYRNTSLYPSNVIDAQMNNSLVIIPVSPLSFNTTYRVTAVGTGFNTITWTFTTGPTPSGTPGATTNPGGNTNAPGTGNPGLNGTPLPVVPTLSPYPIPTGTPGIPAFPTPPRLTDAPVGAGYFQRIPADATNPNFYLRWLRADDPVFNGRANRSWTWGDQPYGFAILQEPYGGQMRIVNYHDKARMEATNATTGFISNGLLVREMISGNAQVGDNQFIPRVPAQVAIVGDVTETNINAPTYYSFYNIASLNNDRRMPNQIGQTVVATASKDGVINVNPGTAVYNVINVYYDNNLGHNIPQVFWDFMNQSGVINTGGGYGFGQVTDWLSTFGLPLTDAYWTRAIVGGEEKDVLLQLFERRVLTFTPSNPDPFKVEMGNVGRHYFKWRYNINY